MKTEDVDVKKEVKDEEIGGLVIPKSKAVFKVPAPKTSSLGMLTLFQSACANAPLQVYCKHELDR